MASSYGISGSNAHIKVTTEELRAKAEAASQKISTVRQSLEEIASLLGKTKGYWVGEAGDLYRSTYQKQDETLMEIVERLEDYPVRLLTIAGIYEPAEAKNVEQAGMLKNDIL